MAIDPNTPVYGTNSPDHYKAVVDVDVYKPNPNDPTGRGVKAKAEVVYIGGGLSTDEDGGTSTSSLIATNPPAPNNTALLASSAASTNAAVGNAAPTKIFNVFGYNSSNNVEYLKIFNKATAPTLGTDTPILNLALPPASAFAFDFEGFILNAGLAYAVTGAAALLDATAIAAGDITGLNILFGNITQ